MNTKEAIERIKARFDKWTLDEEDLEALRALGLVAESEDERIRKQIIDYFSNELHNVKQLTPRTNEVEAWISYLEKQKENHIPWYDYQKSKEAGYTIVPNDEYERLTQKEPRDYRKLYEEIAKSEWFKKAYVGKSLGEGQKPLSTKETELNSIAFLEQMGYTCIPPQKEQKLAEWSEEDDVEALKELKRKIDASMEHIEQKPVQDNDEREYVKTLKGLVSDFIRDSGDGISDVAYYQRICDWLDGRHIEQKPAEWTLPKDFEEAVYKVANFISPFDSQEELRKVSHCFAEQLLSLAWADRNATADMQD